MVCERIEGAWPQLINEESHFYLNEYLKESVGKLGGSSIEDADWKTRRDTRPINVWSVHVPACKSCCTTVCSWTEAKHDAITFE